MGYACLFLALWVVTAQKAESLSFSYHFPKCQILLDVSYEHIKNSAYFRRNISEKIETFARPSLSWKRDNYTEETATNVDESSIILPSWQPHAFEDTSNDPTIPRIVAGGVRNL